MVKKNSGACQLRLLGHHPVLNFLNTVDPRQGPRRFDYLRSFRDLVDWARYARILNQTEARKIAAATRSDGKVADREFKCAIELREALYRIFSSVAARRRPPLVAVAQLLNAHREAVTHAGLIETGDSFRIVWPITSRLIRWRLAEDAVALLQSDNLRRVKQCPGSNDCGWLFFDTSKNATRRWCSMEGCGNRAKLRRFLSRKKSRARTINR
jgi:predicted RNA-binding Zn ribbon-like protein